MTRGGTQPATQRRERPVTSGPSGALLSTQQTADPLLEAYQQAADEELRTRRRLEQRLTAAERRKHTKAGTAGELTTTLCITRRHWPAVHRAAVELGIPLFTQRLSREQTTPLTIRTSKSGALRLGAAVPELRAGQGPA